MVSGQVEEMLDDFDSLYNEMKEQLIKEISQTSLKSDRKRLLDAFFESIDTKASEI